MEQFFKILLTDYACPSFCSFSKAYFGSLAQIVEFIARVKEESPDYDVDGLQKAITAYQGGERNVKHPVAYAEEPFLTPVKVVRHREVILEQHEWTHFNTWGCSYFLRTPRIDGQELLIQDNSCFFRCAILGVQNLEFSVNLERPRWRKLDGGFWGFPGMLKYDEKEDKVMSSLFFVEKNFEKEQDAVDDFLNSEKIELQSFSENIFGDG